MDIKWKTLPDLTRYLISNNGNVFDCKLKRNLTFQESKDGYLKVTLRLDNNLRKTFSVHRLVALAFVLNTENKPTVNHIDGVKSNNVSCNLEWATRSEQTQHAWDNNLISDLQKRKNGIREKQGKPVLCITTLERFSSLGEACEKYSLKKSNLSKVCLNKKGCKTCGTLPDGTKLKWRLE